MILVQYYMHLVQNTSFPLGKNMGQMMIQDDYNYWKIVHSSVGYEVQALPCPSRFVVFFDGIFEYKNLVLAYN